MENSGDPDEGCGWGGTFLALAVTALLSGGVGVMIGGLFCSGFFKGSSTATGIIHATVTVPPGVVAAASSTNAIDTRRIEWKKTQPAYFPKEGKQGQQGYSPDERQAMLKVQPDICKSAQLDPAWEDIAERKRNIVTVSPTCTHKYSVVVLHGAYGTGNDFLNIPHLVDMALKRCPIPNNKNCSPNKAGRGAHRPRAACYKTEAGFYEGPSPAAGFYDRVDYSQYSSHDNSCSIRYVFPNAILQWAHQPRRWSKGQLWYDYCNDADGDTVSDVINTAQWEKSAEFILQLIEEEKRSIWMSEQMEEGVKDPRAPTAADLEKLGSRIMIAGNSQGATVASEVAIRYAAQHKIPLAALAILRGLFLEQTYLKAVPKKTPEDVGAFVQDSGVLNDVFLQAAKNAGDLAGSGQKIMKIFEYVDNDYEVYVEKRHMLAKAAIRSVFPPKTLERIISQDPKRPVWTTTKNGDPNPGGKKAGLVLGNGFLVCAKSDYV